ncbi:MAG: TatD family hydrolase [Treponema sp.]|jgi:TatD DNase family protein|nr:TatD family hydrolase [Treponema sp.]
MFTDVHCHPFDLSQFFPQFEQKRRQLKVLAAASSCSVEEFTHNETIARNAQLDGFTPLLPYFGIHPQQLEVRNEKLEIGNENLLEIIDMLAKEKRIAAIGECGFDLYNDNFKKTEKMQESFFSAQIEIALKHDLPVVLHVRRAMHKIFAAAKDLSKCRAVVFHSWSGTLEEGQSLLRRGVNAFFSFGNTIKLNHKQAKRSCAFLAADRLLTETDAPYQPRLGQAFSLWADIPLIIEATCALRYEAGNNISAKELENTIENNFKKIFYYN